MGGGLKGGAKVTRVLIGGRRQAGPRGKRLGRPLAGWVSVEVGYWVRGPQPGCLLAAWDREDVPPRKLGCRERRAPSTLAVWAPDLRCYAGQCSAWNSPRNSKQFAELSKPPTTTPICFLGKEDTFSVSFASFVQETSVPSLVKPSSAASTVNEAPTATVNLF